MDNPPKFVSVKCQLPNGESSLLDALEVKYNPEIETLNGPVIIGQEFDYQANESTLPSGWFTMPEGFDHTQLSKVEQTNLATLRKGDEYPYICRFSMMVNDSLKIVHGYVEQLSEGQYQCTGGNEITVRDNKGERQILSKLNQFEWLSLINRNQVGKRVKAKPDSDANLCSITSGGDFYGAGFMNASGRCEQEPEIYWSNGRRWAFSSKHSQYSYR